MRVITITRKPLEGTVAANAMTHGCGGLHIDGCRIATTETLSIGSNNRTKANINFGMADNKAAQGQHALGRWPANVILVDATARAVDDQSGISTSTGGRTVKRSGGGNVGSGKASEVWWTNDDPGFGDTGGASRFFKVVTSE